MGRKRFYATVIAVLLSWSTAFAGFKTDNFTIVDLPSGDTANISYNQSYYGRLSFSVDPNNTRSEVKYSSKGATGGAGQTYFVIGASDGSSNTGNNLLLGVSSGRAFISNAWNYSDGSKSLWLGGNSWTNEGVVNITGLPGTGSLWVNGSIRSIGNTTADHFIGGGELLTGIPTHDQVTNTTSTVSFGRNLTSSYDGDNNLTISATTGLNQISGLRLQRGAWGTDNYNDYSLYAPGGVLTLSGIYNNNTGNIFTSDINNFSITPPLKAINTSITGWLNTTNSITSIMNSNAININFKAQNTDNGTTARAKFAFWGANTTSDSTAVEKGYFEHIGIGNTASAGGVNFNNSINFASSADKLIIWQSNAKPIYMMTNSTNRLIVEGDGNVGIGTIDPEAKLHVNGTTSFYGNVSIGTSLKSDYLYINGSAGGFGGLTIQQPSGSYVTFKNATATTWNFGSASDNSFRIANASFASTTRLYIGINGSVGINTLVPGTQFQVNGTSSYYGNMSVDGVLNITGQEYTPRYNNTNSTDISINWSNSNVQSVIVAENCNITMNGGNDGGKYTLIVKQDNVGSRLITWGSETRFADNVTPILTTTANKTDYFNFIYNGLDSKYDCVGQRLNF